MGRFAGYDPETKELNVEILRKYIFGGHVADYMRQLQEEDSERYQKQFSRFIKAGIKADDLEGMYAKAHAAIRADPEAKAKKEYKDKATRHPSRNVKMTLKERRSKIAARKNTIRQKRAAAAAE